MDDPLEIKDGIAFQGSATEIGHLFERTCNNTLKALGFKLLGQRSIREAGIIVDQVAVNHRHKEIFFEYKGSYKPPRPGLIRTDTAKKALCNAFLMERCGLAPFVILTSHKPKPNSSSQRMIDKAGSAVFDVIVLGDADDMARLQGMLKLDEFSTVEHLEPRDRKPDQPYLQSLRLLSSADNEKTPPSKSPKRYQKASRRNKDALKKPRSRKKKTRSEDQPDLFD
jgi:hypothetical protein